MGRMTRIARMGKGGFGADIERLCAMFGIFGPRIKRIFWITRMQKLVPRGNPWRLNAGISSPIREIRVILSNPWLKFCSTYSRRPMSGVPDAATSRRFVCSL
jgi:hypothetical protein